MKVYWQGTLPTRPRGYAPGVDSRKEARELLVSRRAKITPEQANLPAGTNRRVPGLRRSEVAALAGVSIEYYSKLERGALAGVSAGVLDAVARALQLDDMDLLAANRLARAFYADVYADPLASWTSTPDRAPAVSTDSDIT
jgi:transcriptional regulator with XRE-family HTH domain